MCRIAGFWDFRAHVQYDHHAVLDRMRDTLAYGGPDSAGSTLIRIDQSSTLALAHRRLSIIDLSPAGHQPMQWEHISLIFNGEIYNYAEIAARLSAEGYTFSSGSDTEVLIKAVNHWGTKQALSMFRGMFAFALWDERSRKLTLCRDRVGVKPLYWYHRDGLLLFASELKAFHSHPHFHKSLSRPALSLYLQQGYITPPHCIFEHCRALEPGHYIEVSPDGTTQDHVYWDVWSDAVKPSPALDDTEWIQRTEDVLQDSFRLRMVADVPVGMFLSGGIDSSLVTALLQKDSSRPLNTFTIGFDNPLYNEAPFARAVAEHLGTHHNELICTEDDFKSVVPHLADFYDEPFGDSSAIPTYIVSALARRQVTVSLSADGGDELFGGYAKHDAARRLYPRISALPFRGALSSLTQRIDPDRLESWLADLPYLRNHKGIANKFSKLRHALQADDVFDFFDLSSVYLTPADVKALCGHHEPRSSRPAGITADLLNILGAIDARTYLVGDIMTKVDRATMQVALEGREPFLDHHVIEHALSMPDALKHRDGKNKWILRQILYRYVPSQLIERPKQGFAIPIADWLRGTLRDELRSMLSDSDFYEAIGLSRQMVSYRVEAFLSRSAYINPHSIWFLYILYRWYNRWYINP